MISKATGVVSPWRVITLAEGGPAGSLLRRLKTTTVTDRGATGVQELVTARLLLKSLISKHRSMVDSEARSPHLLLMLWGAHNGNRLGQHQLIGAVSVKIHTGQERGLRGVRLQMGRKSLVRESQAALKPCPAIFKEHVKSMLCGGSGRWLVGNSVCHACLDDLDSTPGTHGGRELTPWNRSSDFHRWAMAPAHLHACTCTHHTLLLVIMHKGELGGADRIPLFLPCYCLFVWNNYALETKFLRVYVLSLWERRRRLHSPE